MVSYVLSLLGYYGQIYSAARQIKRMMNTLNGLSWDMNTYQIKVPSDANGTNIDLSISTTNPLR